jgi:hypothetical protein
MTAEKLGYKQAKADEIDLINKKRDAIVGLDIGLEKGAKPESAQTPASQTPTSASALKPETPPTTPETLTPIKPATEVGRGSLEDILKNKKAEEAPKVEEKNQPQLEAIKPEEKIEQPPAAEKTTENKLIQSDTLKPEPPQSAENKPTEIKPPAKDNIFG